MSEQLELDGMVEQWEQFKSEISDDELKEVGEDIINCTKYLLSVGGDTNIDVGLLNCVQQEFETLMNRYLKIQICVGEESYLWFVEKMKSFGIPTKFNEMLESHQNKGAIKFV